MAEPPTIHDFSGFPKTLYEKQYSSPGAPELARRIKEAIPDPVIHLDFNWGLDHGTWSVLGRMFPEADVPVVQLSLDFDQPPAFHYALGRKLAYLRSEGVLVMGSGNMVHNLRTLRWEDMAFDWARDFDALLAERILSGDHEALVDYPSLGEHASWAIPTNEHYLPLLYVMGMQDESDEIGFFNDRVTLGSISMRSILLSG
jgi:4,5-DOPA dioxygenase extradiol